MIQRYRYPRTFHLPWSPGRSRDDLILEDTRHFEGHEVIVLEKLDGECTTIYPDGYVHSRSIDGNHHPSQSWVKSLAAAICWKIPLHCRVVGENLYARHSIPYNLPTYFYLFAFFGPEHSGYPGDILYSWDDTKAMAAVLGVPTPRELYRGEWNPDKIMVLEKELDFTQTEGYVVRKTDWGYTALFGEQVAKYVRPNHITTTKRWDYQWERNKAA